jgi:hypothetical protein
MPGRCTICDHEQRDEIEVIHIQGASTRDIAGQFAVTKSSVSRHMNAHLAPAVLEPSRIADRQRVESLQSRLEQLYARAEMILDQAEAASRRNVALAGIRELRGILEFASKLAGGFADQPPVTIQLSLHDGTPLRPLGPWRKTKMNLTMEQPTRCPNVRTVRVSG